MSKPRNAFERMAQDAATRLDQVRAAGEQLAFLPDEPGRTPAEAGSGDAAAKGGRPKGAQGKGSSQLRKWLTARGLRLPEEQLADIAGLASSEGAMMTAMRQAEMLLAWAYDGAETTDGKHPLPSPEARLSTFMQLYAMQLRAADALLPYGTPKASPDVNVQQAVQIVLPGASSGADRPAQARDVTPSRAGSRRGMVPADVAWEIEQDQRVDDDASDVSDEGNSDE